MLHFPGGLRSSQVKDYSLLDCISDDEQYFGVWLGSYHFILSDFSLNCGVQELFDGHYYTVPESVLFLYRYSRSSRTAHALLSESTFVRTVVGLAYDLTVDDMVLASLELFCGSKCPSMLYDGFELFN